MSISCGTQSPQHQEPALLGELDLLRWFHHTKTISSLVFSSIYHSRSITSSRDLLNHFSILHHKRTYVSAILHRSSALHNMHLVFSSFTPLPSICRFQILIVAPPLCDEILSLQLFCFSTRRLEKRNHQFCRYEWRP